MAHPISLYIPIYLYIRIFKTLNRRFSVPAIAFHHSLRRISLPQRLMKELLIREDCNVLIVNWIGGAGPPYTQAVANTRLVGAMTARLAYKLVEVGGIDSTRMHCIGHSLGAHTCGYIGYALRHTYDHKLGRITGESRSCSLKSKLLSRGSRSVFSRRNSSQISNNNYYARFRCKSFGRLEANSTTMEQNLQ